MKTTHKLIVTVLAALAVLAGCVSLQPHPWADASAARSLPIALASMATSLDAAENRATILSTIDEIIAAHPEVRLISFGEASLGWYTNPRDPAGYQRSVAEPVDGPTVEALRREARRHGVYIALGFAELRDGLVYDSAVLIDDRGEIVAHRHKSHFVLYDKLNRFTPGPRVLTTAEVDGIEFALLICADVNDPAYRAAVAEDAEIQVVLLPQASAGLRPDAVSTKPSPFPGRWFLAPQRHGKEGPYTYLGSWVIDPAGYMAARADGPGYTYHVLRVR